MATTASLPAEDSTESLTPPSWTKNTLFACAPWAKTTAPVANRTVRGDTLADLRNA